MLNSWRRPGLGKRTLNENEPTLVSVPEWRRHMVNFLLGLTISSLAFFCLVSNRASAVEPDEFEVLIRGETLDTRVTSQPPGQTLGSFNGALIVRVGGEPCVTVDLASARNTTGDVVIRVGAPGQPTHCSVEGSAVTFCNSRSQEFFQQLVFARGTQDVLYNFVPVPPGRSSSCATTVTASNVRPPDTGDGGIRLTLPEQNEPYQAVLAR